MFPSIGPPTNDALRSAVRAEASSTLTYAEVGHTWIDLPEGFDVDEQEVVVGHGQADFGRAVALLRAWTPFDLPWIRPLDRAVPLEEGEMFAFAAHHLGLWTSNVCRIVRVVDERGPSGARFGYSYGTVGTHSLRGEERFLIRWESDSDTVTFGIRKFSVPSGLWLWLLTPLARRVQKQFTQDALARLAQAMPT